MTGAYLKISDEKSLELRFTARRAEKLESELDCDLLLGLSRCQRVGVLTRFIACGADISHSEACDAYDEFVDNGGTDRGRVRGRHDRAEERRVHREVGSRSRKKNPGAAPQPCSAGELIAQLRKTAVDCGAYTEQFYDLTPAELCDLNSSAMKRRTDEARAARCSPGIRRT